MGCCGVASNTAEPAPAQDEAAPVEKFEWLFCAVVSVPKSVVEQEEAKERTRNQKKREQKKALKKS
jgi:hypothetical protein